MTNSAPFPIFDGHNDILLKLLEECPEDPAKAFFSPRKGQHIDLQSAQKGGFIGGLFAMFIPQKMANHSARRQAKNLRATTQ